MPPSSTVSATGCRDHVFRQGRTSKLAAWTQLLLKNRYTHDPVLSVIACLHQVSIPVALLSSLWKNSARGTAKNKRPCRVTGVRTGGRAYSNVLLSRFPLAQRTRSSIHHSTSRALCNPPNAPSLALPKPYHQLYREP